MRRALTSWESAAANVELLRQSAEMMLGVQLRRSWQSWIASGAERAVMSRAAGGVSDWGISLWTYVGSHSNQIAITWQSHDALDLRGITWQSHGNHMAITWQSHGNHMAIT